MQEIWFWLVSVMVAIYVVLDGFDFGAGALHLFVAKSNEERREVLAAIGPFWDGNEVWLLAGGGSMFLAFPKVLASGFSGFYLALFLVLWVLLFRGISIEFRSHVNDAIWRAVWDFGITFSGILMPVLLGAALGNVIRGVPLGPEGTFELAFWTNFKTGNPVGILDWYTVLVGVMALVTLTAHGAVFLSWKTTGMVHERCRALAPKLWIGTLVLWLLTTAATNAVNPALLAALPYRPLGWLFTAVFLVGLATVYLGLKQKRDLLAFVGSSAFILGLLAASAACVWPVMLRSTLGAAHNLTAVNASAADHGLRTGLVWWLVGFPIAIGYFVMLMKVHRGKVSAPAEGEGY